MWYALSFRGAQTPLLAARTEDTFHDLSHVREIREHCNGPTAKLTVTAQNHLSLVIVVLFFSS